MFNFIRHNQMDIMLFLCAVCTAMAAMLFITKFLPRKRRGILISMEVVATLLLFFDRLAYIYAGVHGSTAYIMVRLANFMVFFITGGIILVFNLYLIDLLTNEGKLTTIPRRLKVVSVAAVAEMLMVILNIFTGFYYYFDAVNRYHRGSGFLICYIVPVVCPIIQFTAIHKHRASFSRLIYIAILLYIFVPIAMGIIQIFAYGISIVNMAMVLVSVSLYFFTYLDINAEAEKAHSLEIQLLKSEQQSMKKLFGQTATAFTHALEKQAKATQGLAERTATIARKIATVAGKREEECDKIYYAALLSGAGAESLSYIQAFPYLSETALYADRRYDGTDKRGEHGDALPEYARILCVAKDYARLTADKATPRFFVREAFIREAGGKYDPDFAKIAVHLLDTEAEGIPAPETKRPVAPELESAGYRENVTAGIPILSAETEISFDCAPLEQDKPFSAPSLIVFDAFDGQVHENAQEIQSYRYLEYGEIWFDAHIIATSAKNMEVRNETEADAEAGLENTTHKAEAYQVTCSRYEDHVLLKLSGSKKRFEVIVALPSASKAAYIALTGENARLTNISITETARHTNAESIPRIAEKVVYTDRLTSDLPNVQINRPLEAFTAGVEVKDKMKIQFHTQSLPEANLVWHCPYIVLYASDDHKVHGKNYREYALVKLDGEDNGSSPFATNRFVMKKTEAFKTWPEWEKQNKAGYECQIDFFKDKNTVSFKTHNKGIYIENTTTILDGTKELYVALTGDQCALTDIRVR